MKKVFIILCCLAVTAGFMIIPSGAAEKTKKSKAGEPASVTEKPYITQTIYTCPMHPEVRREKPGKCPVCGMHLEAKKECFTSECTDISCEMMAKKATPCPIHKKEMKKKEIKFYCPHCGAEVNPDELKKEKTK